MLGARELPLQELYTDTGGASDHVFGLCHLLGFRLVPRMRDLADRRLGAIAASSTYKGIECLFGQAIKVGAIEAEWDDLIRMAASIREEPVRHRSSCASFQLTAGRTSSIWPCANWGALSGHCSRSTGWSSPSCAVPAKPG